MTTYSKRSKNRCPTHPGAFLREIVLPEIEGVTKVEIADALGVSRQTLHDILTEQQPVTPKMAVRLAIVFDTTPESWVSMQTAYDLWHAVRQVDASGVHNLTQKEVEARPVARGPASNTARGPFGGVRATGASGRQVGAALGAASTSKKARAGAAGDVLSFNVGTTLFQAAERLEGGVIIEGPFAEWTRLVLGFRVYKLQPGDQPNRRVCADLTLGDLITGIDQAEHDPGKAPSFV